MAKATTNKLAAAQARLRRIETLISPYEKDMKPKGNQDRGEWIPGDYANVRGREDSPRLKVPEAN